MNAGARLGYYEIVAPLGAGAMGEVYRARDTRLGREVAIKILSPALGNTPDALRRFEHEARTLAALSHPNVAVLHGFEEIEGMRFLVMELVDGEPLDRRLAGRALPTREALHIAAQIADALDAAHRRGIIHRDLKPANMMIGPRGEVKLLDFGISKLIDHDRPEATTDDGTAAGTVIGTIPYMSPEQVAGGQVDQRTDVWSFGCVLYEMLTGAKPFQGGSAAAVAAAIVSQPPRLERLPDDLPSTAREIIERCLQKDRADRLASLADVGPALRHRAAAGVPPPSRRRAALVLAATLAVVTLLMVMQPWRKDTPTPARPPTVSAIAVLPLANDSPDSAADYFVDGMTDALINDLASLNLWKVISRTSVMQYRQHNKPLPVIARELGVDSVIEGSVFRAGDRVRISARLIHAATEQPLWNGTYERDLKDILALQRGVARDIATELKGRLAPEVAGRLGADQPVDPETHLLFMQGRFLWNERTADSLRQAIAHFDRALQRDPAHAPAYAGLAESYVLLAGPGTAGLPPGEAFPKAIDAARRAIDIDPALAGAHATLGYAALLWQWDWPAAERHFSAAITANPNYANAYFWYAAGLASRGRIDEAIERAKKAVELDPVSPIITAGLAWMHHFGRDDEAVVARIRPLLELNPRFPTLHNRIAVAYRHQGRHPQAIDHHRKAVEASGENPDMLAELAVSLAAGGERGEAERLLARLEAQAARAYLSAYARAMIHLALGDRARALDWLEKAADERSWSLPFMAVEPDLDPLRGEPRFQRLLQRVRVSDVSPFSR